MKPWSILLALTLLISACSGKNISNTMANNAMKDSSTGLITSSEINPLFTESTLYLKYPPFDKIKDAHFVPAMEQGMVEQLAEIEAIANQAEAPTLENTLIEMEKSGQLFSRATTVFFCTKICSHHCCRVTKRFYEYAPAIFYFPEKVKKVVHWYLVKE